MAVYWLTISVLRQADRPKSTLWVSIWKWQSKNALCPPPTPLASASAIYIEAYNRIGVAKLRKGVIARCRGGGVLGIQ